MFAEVKQLTSNRTHLAELDPARPPTPSEMRENENTLAVESFCAQLPRQLIRELRLDPSRSYQSISPVYDVADVPTHVSGMS
jgi:hypothetical protein